MEERRKKLLVRSALVGGIVGVVIATKSKQGVCSCLKEYYEKTTDILKFINENRTEIIEQLKNTSDKVTKTIDETNKDLKAISENVKHLKDSSTEMITTVQETKNQLFNLYQTCKQKYEGSTAEIKN